MSDDTHDTDQPVGGLVDALARLCETLERLERTDSTRTVGHGRGRRGPVSIDFDYSVSIGTLDDALPSDRSRARRPGGVANRPGHGDSTADDTDQPSANRRGDGATEAPTGDATAGTEAPTGNADDETTPDQQDFPVVVRETEAGVTVVADLPDVSERRPSVTVVDGGIELAEGDVLLGRVPLPEGLSIADTSVNNGVLEVELTRE